MSSFRSSSSLLQADSKVRNSSDRANKVFVFILFSKFPTDGPRTFESLLFLDNPSLYRYLFSIKNNSDSTVMMIRSLVKALETYADNSLTGLYYASLGQEEYFRILSRVLLLNSKSLLLIYFMCSVLYLLIPYS